MRLRRSALAVFASAAVVTALVGTVETTASARIRTAGASVRANRTGFASIHQPAEFVHRPHHWRRGTTVANSFNWAGYVDAPAAPGTFTRVSGTWVVPKVTCTREHTELS